MSRAVSRYEQYWELLKQNRGQVIELRVPAEYHERIVKALRKRKGKAHANTVKQYPEFEIVRQPLHPVTKKPQQDIIHITLPVDMIDTI